MGCKGKEDGRDGRGWRDNLGVEGGRMGKFYWGKTETWQRGIEGVNVWGLPI